MPDIANLMIRIDSDGVEIASGRLGDLVQSGDRAEKKTKDLTSSIMKKVAALGAATFSVRALISETRASIAAYEERERGEIALASAIAATGREAEMSVQSIVRYASHIQDTTLFSSEAATAAAATLQQFADLREDGIQRALPAIADFASAMGMDLPAAAQAFARSLSGPTNMLGRYGIEIDTTLDSSGRLEQALAQVESRFGGLSRELNDAATGALPRFRNSLNDARALMGRDIVNAFAPAMRQISQWVDEQNAARQAQIDREEGLAAVLEGRVRDEQQIVAAMEQANIQLEEAQRLLGLAARGGAEAVERRERELRAAENLVEQIRVQGDLARQALAGQREAAREAERRAQIEEQAQQAREEAIARENAMNEAATEFRQRIQQQYAQFVINSEEDRIAQIEMMRERELEHARENFVQTGQEIAMINEMYDAQITAEQARQQKEREDQHEQHLDRLRSAVGPVFEDMMTEQDKLSRSLDALWEAYAAGAITVDEYAAAHDHLIDQFYLTGEAASRWNEELDRMNQAMTTRAVNAMADGLYDIGFALGENAVGASTFQQAIGNVGRTIMGLIPQLAIAAGLRILMENPWDARGWWLIGGGAVGMVAAGTMEGAIASQSAHGNVFDHGNVSAFKRGGAFTNSIVDKPTLFPMAQGMGLMGEAGPEAVMPLTRTSSGDLGVRVEGGGGAASVFVNVINNSSHSETSSEEVTDSDGSRHITVMIEDTVERGINTGRFDRANSRRYGMAPKGRRV